MMFAQEKMSLDNDVIFSLQLSSMTGQRNILTIHYNGDFTYQPDFNKAEVEKKLSGDTSAQDFLQANLPTEEFLEKQMHYYELASAVTCGTAANLFLRIGDREHWLGIWNYGADGIPEEIDAGMYHAAVQLADRLYF